MIDELVDLSIGLNHFLVMAAALNGTSSANLLGHEAEDTAEPPALLRTEFLEVVLHEVDVFHRLSEIPHAQLLVALLGMALPNVLEFLAPDQEK